MRKEKRTIGIFLSLEKSRQKKTCMRRLVDKQDKEIILNSKAIMAELKDFYHDLETTKIKIIALKSSIAIWKT